MVAISRVEVNHDGYGGTAPDAMVWDRGGIVKPRASSLRLHWRSKTALGVPCILSPSLGKMSLSGPTVSTSSLSSLPFWPHCIGLRVILIWGKFGISCFELLLMFEIYVGHRLHAEKSCSSP